jgi:hypothetical protein
MKFVCVLTLGMLVGPGSEVVVDAGHWDQNAWAWRSRPLLLLVVSAPDVDGHGTCPAGLRECIYTYRCGERYFLDTAFLGRRNVRRLFLPGHNKDS